MWLTDSSDESLQEETVHSSCRHGFSLDGRRGQSEGNRLSHIRRQNLPMVRLSCILSDAHIYKLENMWFHRSIQKGRQRRWAAHAQPVCCGSWEEHEGCQVRLVGQQRELWQTAGDTARAVARSWVWGHRMHTHTWAQLEARSSSFPCLSRLQSLFKWHTK